MAPTVAPTVAPTIAASPAPAAVAVEAQGGELGESLPKFAPSKIEVKAGDIVRLVDVGSVLHDLTIDVGGTVPTSADQHVAVQIPIDLLNKTNQAAINLPPGTYKFYCSIDLGTPSSHTADGMIGIITIH